MAMKGSDLVVALTVLRKQEAVALWCCCNHIYQRPVVGVCPPVTDKDDACGDCLLPVGLKLCIQPLLGILQEGATEIIVARACVPPAI